MSAYFKYIEFNKFTSTLFDKISGSGDTLENLRASENNFATERIPNLSEYISLKELWLVNNNFIGDLPPSIASLTKLGEWGIGSSSPFSVFVSFSSLLHFSLESLLLQDNDLSGSLPDNIGNMVALEKLSVTNNTKLSRDIPSSIGQLLQLEEFRFKNAGLTGNIPTDFGNLANLKIFEASSNELDGGIPPIEKLDKLGEFVNHIPD